MKKYDLTKNLKFLILSAALIGIAYCFWGAVIFFAGIMAMSFLYNKKTIHSVWFVAFIVLGSLPKLILDQLILGSFAVGILRYALNSLSGFFWGGIYGDLSAGTYNPLFALPILLLIPFSIYKLFSKESIKEPKNKLVFIILSLLLAFIFPQIRYLLMTVPIVLFEAAPKLRMPQLRRHLIISLVLIFLVITPYIIQINYSTNTYNFETLIKTKGNIQIDNSEKLLQEDLDKISKEFSNETFVIGNEPDDYMDLSLDYWGKDIFFASIQDYNLYFNGDPDIFSETFNPKSTIQNRREIWISGGMRRNSIDKTDYQSIKYGLSEEDHLDLEGFKLIKKYNELNLFKKIN